LAKKIPDPIKIMALQDILRSLGKTVMVRHLVKRNLTQLLKEKNLCSQVALYSSLLDSLIAAALSLDD
jgi:hypothetical protein